MTLLSATLTLLEKSAVDNGFDQELPRQGEWLGFASTHAPLKVWLAADANGRPVAALSRLDVVRALAEHGTLVSTNLPIGADAARSVEDVVALHRMLRRAYQLARTLPDEPLLAFEKAIAVVPSATEIVQLTRQRVGQDIFRARLLEFWEGRCAITGLAVPELLRASHIKPWADCATDAERLDVFNGVLLAPHLDAAFDTGFITVTDDGAVVISSALSDLNRKLIHLSTGLRLDRLEDRHREYLQWHRERIFRGQGP